MINSMTGFASGKGSAENWSWSWDLRSVNARGMDIRLRLPDWIDGLEIAVRNAIKKYVARGNVTLNLRVQRDSDQGLVMDPEVLDMALASIKEIEEKALGGHDLELAPTSAAQILSLPTLGGSSTNNQDTKPLLAALKRDLDRLLTAFDEMRKAEGRALEEVLNAHLDQIETLTRSAAAEAENRRETTAATLRKNLAIVLDNTDGADPDRVAQELALIAVKSDVTEEIDRLHAHVGAARVLLGSKGPMGRKLDFLTQEFNREANTLCSKAQYKELTRIGLDLKAVIDQMREQVQNVE